MHTASSASRTYLASRSASEYTITATNVEFAAGALDAQRNFATVGDQNFFEHGTRSSLIR
jgi:hypothetical protein